MQKKSPKQKPFWTSADGRKIPYHELTDKHLQNIIRDGYRNDDLFREAKRRKMLYPMRLVDMLSIQEYMQWVESICSCALSDDPTAEEMALEWSEGRIGVFNIMLNRLLEDHERSTGISRYERERVYRLLKLSRQRTRRKPDIQS